VTKQNTLKDSRHSGTGVILNDRFVHRESVSPGNSWAPFLDSDEMIERLAEYFAITQTDVFALSDSDPAETVMPAIVDDMPRFQQSARDGLHVPKEGKDGTGN